MNQSTGHAGLAVGFIGLGKMGEPMARRLLSAGCALVVSDVDMARCDALSACGAAVANSPQAVAEQAQIIFACLPSAEVSRRVALGAAGVVHGNSVRILVDCSTLSPEHSRDIAAQLAEANIDFVDAPISGGPAGASAGTLSAVVSGRKTAVDAIRPILASVASTVVEAGEAPGLAQVYKLVNQGITFASVVLTAEAIAAGVKAGADAERLLAFLNASTARNWATSVKFPQTVLPRKFTAGSLSIVQKDMQAYLDMCRAASCPAVMGAAADSIWQAVAALLGPDAELASIAPFYERFTGVEIRGGHADS